MTIQESLEVQAVNLLQNHSQRARDCRHALKALAVWWWAAQLNGARQIERKVA